MLVNTESVRDSGLLDSALNAPFQTFDAPLYPSLQSKAAQLCNGLLCGHPKLEPVRIAKLIRLYDLPVSAGTGEFLDGESYEEISVTDFPAGSDYALRVFNNWGDSMEPKYHDGQIVYCHKQSTLENGEIGIFILNDKGYCKRLKQNENGTFLISLNKKYAPSRCGMRTC